MGNAPPPPPVPAAVPGSPSFGPPISLADLDWELTSESAPTGIPTTPTAAAEQMAALRFDHLTGLPIAEGVLSTGGRVLPTGMTLAGVAEGDFSGMLEKKGRVFEGWKGFFFVLTGSELQYFVGEGDHALGQAPQGCFTVTAFTDVPDRGGRMRSHRIDIHDTTQIGEPLLLSVAAVTADDKQVWIEQLGAVAETRPLIEHSRFAHLATPAVYVEQDMTSLHMLSGQPDDEHNMLDESTIALALHNNISISELEAATDGFADSLKVNEGAFGAVYRGTLQGRMVAVKVLKPAASSITVPARAQEFTGIGGFRKELEILSKCRHINVVSLVGACLSSDKAAKQCLVVEFMAGGTLRTRLASRTMVGLTVEDRLCIASDAARGTEYLHVGCDPPIFAFDLKSDNILLTKVKGRLIAKLADFGTARCTPKDLDQDNNTHHSTRVVIGTKPYMPMEYMQMGHVSPKTDAFSFGVVLCELLTGKPPVSMEENEMLSFTMLGPLGGAGSELQQLLDPRVGGVWPLQRAIELGRIARRCIEPVPGSRSTVAGVLPNLDALAGRGGQDHGGEPEPAWDESTVVVTGFEQPMSGVIGETAASTGSGRARVRLGQCPSCGNQTHSIGCCGLMRTPLTIPSVVNHGSCLFCNPQHKAPAAVDQLQELLDTQLKLKELLEHTQISILQQRVTPHDAPAVSAIAEPCLVLEKFNSGTRTMRTGRPVDAARGIWAALGIEAGDEHGARIQGNGLAEIAREFTTPGEYCDDKDRVRFEYVFEQTAELLVQDNGVKRDIGNEGMTLDHFCMQPDARKAKLKKAHVLALRLYTSNSFARINGPLRDGTKPHPFAATTFYVHDALLRLRTAGADNANARRVFWRGLDDMSVSENFVKEGGTEIGCMSTTQDRTVAETKFAKAGERPNPLLLKVEATSFMNCGADIHWLSMYPEEKEVLFPPLTYLQPEGEPVLENGCTVITVHPNLCF
jgi:serine/threonine protein kinase